MIVFKRKIYKQLSEWKNSVSGQKALLLEGARRIGKSTIVEEFAKNEYKSYILIDFNKASRAIKSAFDLYMNDLDTFFMILSSEYNIREELKTADLVVGSVLIPGAKAPKLVTREMLALMQPGSVLVDVAIDQGGCFETSRPTTHEEPTYYVGEILHYCVANIPGAVPYTSTLALTNATLPYALQLADKGWRKACADNEELRKGLNVVEGKVVYREVAEAWGLPYEPLSL